MAKTIKSYDQDFYAWTIQNAKLLRQGKWDEVDIEHLAEEIESMGKSERRELINRLAQLLAHLLKWQFQEGRRSNSWKYTIEEQRDEIVDLIEDSPSLKNELKKQLNKAYKKALLLAAAETELNKETFPKSCPYSLNQILKMDFYPKA